MIAFMDSEQLALPKRCLHCNAPIALSSALCPMCGHRADRPLTDCDCLVCHYQRLKQQRPRWLSPPQPSQ